MGVSDAAQALALWRTTPRVSGKAAIARTDAAATWAYWRTLQAAADLEALRCFTDSAWRRPRSAANHALPRRATASA